MGVIEAILYGIVQGLTEWLPISSTAHLRILPALLNQPDPGSAFTAVIQLGTTLAVLIYFGKDLGAAISAWARSFRGKTNSPEERIGWAVFWGSFPIVLIGFALRKVISSPDVRSLYVISGTLIVMGIIMLIAERVGTQKRGAEEITVKDGIVVGLWQALALVPGMSRSGSTISGALFAGLERSTAARFSFLLSVPSVLAAGLFELIENRHEILGQQLGPVLIATAVSFVVGYASIAFLLKFIQKNGFSAFVVYRIVLGIVLLVLISQGIVKPTEAAPSPPEVAQSVSTTL
ncbi:MAG: undecaprenyl-diphosphate phosphatase [Fimbriimonas sp.]